MKEFKGTVLFLDRDDINTDEIIPAKYLTEIKKEALGPHCLEDLKLPGFSAAHNVPGKKIIITRNNFGCGSSREHAPWSLEMNGIHMVIASGFARIFRQNMYNCGMIALELPVAVIDRLFSCYSGHDTTAAYDLPSDSLTVHSGVKSETISAPLSGFDRTLVESGGWVAVADTRY